MNPKLRRGFKAEAERVSHEMRRELNRGTTDRLDPAALAEHLGIPVFGLREFARRTGVHNAARHFLMEDTGSFSAMTVFSGGRCLIVHNEGHAATRQASNLAHELAHILCEHSPTQATILQGMLTWHEAMEEEAKWLSGALLVPRDGALALAKGGHSTEDIAARFGVSVRFCRWRISTTGIARQLERTKNMFAKRQVRRISPAGGRVYVIRRSAT